jgi:hypothetical protein
VTRTAAGPTDWFTGTVYIDGIQSPDDRTIMNPRTDRGLRIGRLLAMLADFMDSPSRPA